MKNNLIEKYNEIMYMSPIIVCVYKRQFSIKKSKVSQHSTKVNYFPTVTIVYKFFN